MSHDFPIDRGTEWRRGFDKLSGIAYSNFLLNTVNVRNLGMHFMDCDESWYVKKHRHSFYEMHYVATGETRTKINGEEMHIQAGQFYIMAPGVFHAHGQPPCTAHTGFALRWQFQCEAQVRSLQELLGGEMERIAEEAACIRPIPVDDTGQLARQVDQWIEAVINGRPRLMLQAGFVQVILEALSQSKGSCPGEKGIGELPGQPLDHRIVEAALRFIEENYLLDMDVEDVARSVHLSYSHLSRLFKRHTGQSIGYHINRTRLIKAQQLLVCSTMTVGRIAGEVGFNSEEYFINLFRRFFGVSPAVYRAGRNPLDE